VLPRSESDVASPLSAYSELSAASAPLLGYPPGMSPNGTLHRSPRHRQLSAETGYQTSQPIKTEMVDSLMSTMDEDPETIGSISPDSIDMWSMMSNQSGPSTANTSPLNHILPDPQPDYLCGMDVQHDLGFEGLPYPMHLTHDKDLSLVSPTDDDFLNAFFASSD